ncbi:MAG: ATP synthase F1 subunit delta [Candidatus Eremiobacterota bacterium]
MLLETVANRYAEALYQMAREAKDHKNQLKELEKVYEIIKTHPALGRAVASPTIPSQVKKNILRQLLDQRVSTRTLHFFYLLVDKNREVYVRAVVEAFRELLRRDEGVVKCRAEVASPIDAATRDRLLEQLRKVTGMTIELEVVENPALLGGVVLAVGGRLIDGSLASQLQHIRQRLALAAGSSTLV